MSTTTTLGTEKIPSSRTETAPEDLPVYGWGQAPAHLRTQTQMAAERLKLGPEQKPVAYLHIQRHGDFELYDPADGVKMRPLPSSTKAKMAKRRTCSECGKVFREVLNGRPCTACRDKERKARERLAARTCKGCETVRKRPYPKDHGRCQDCRQEQLVTKRRRVEEWLQHVTVCAENGCTAKVNTRKAARAWLKEHPWLLRPEAPWLPDQSWRPGDLRCPPCEKVDEQRREEQRARWAREETERWEEERQAVHRNKAWAAAALTDPGVVVLDTETTGLHAEACIVELAVISSAGDVLLDCLVDPQVPIPSDASDIHGITAAEVAGVKTFSQLLVELTGLLDGKRVLIYNKSYDVGVLRWELTRHYRAAGHEDPAASAAAWLDVMTFEDVMVPYSRWCGDWSEYHGDYCWQPLNGGHRAADDCRAVLDCLRAMAKNYEADEPQSELAALGAGGWGEGTAN